jgi:predicted metal-dependent hydrolase
MDDWQRELGVTADFWGIKRMKTKWGSCNPETRRIWFNSELAKKPLGCLQMLVVHELVHLVVPSRGEDFAEKMSQALPDWQSRRAVLNSLPLAHDSWDY